MADTKPTPEALEARKRWFEDYCRQLDESPVVAEPTPGVDYPCPRYYCLTLGERGGFDICPVCFWKDDGQDADDADSVRGGPNSSLSLTQARANHARLGVCDQALRSSAFPELDTPRAQLARRRARHVFTGGL